METPRLIRQAIDHLEKIATQSLAELHLGLRMAIEERDILLLTGGDIQIYSIPFSFRTIYDRRRGKHRHYVYYKPTGQIWIF